MGKRAAQLVLIALAGALIAWWLTRESEPRARRPVVRAEVIAPSPSTEPMPAASSPPRERSFRLPEMPAAKPDVKVVPEPPPPAQFGVPKDWMLRGSASKSYELRSDKGSVFSGNASVMLRSHEGEIQPNLTGSAVQAVLAAPYVGKRVQLTVAMRATARFGPTAMAWMYVTDPARVVIAYQLVQMRLETNQPKAEWRRYRVVMDVPWHGEVLAYGFSLQGRGALWADDVRLTAVDPNVPLTGSQNSYQLGVIAQAVSADGALANPSNLDFEDILMTRERQDPPPPDTIDGTRF